MITAGSLQGIADTYARARRAQIREKHPEYFETMNNLLTKAAYEGNYELVVHKIPGHIADVLQADLLSADYVVKSSKQNDGYKSLAVNWEKPIGN